MPKKNISFKELLGIETDPVLKVAIERLRPPREVETPDAEKHVKVDAIRESHGTHEESGSQTSEMDPFLWLSSNHSFQMVILELMKKFAPGLEHIKTRGKKQVLKQSFNNQRNKLIKERGTMSGVINEFEQKVKELRKRNEKTL